MTMQQQRNINRRSGDYDVRGEKNHRILSQAITLAQSPPETKVLNL